MPVVRSRHNNRPEITRVFRKEFVPHRIGRTGEIYPHGIVVELPDDDRDPVIIVKRAIVRPFVIDPKADQKRYGQTHRQPHNVDE
jgi:hypothetical protein